jgi:fatty acid desaturase
VNPEPTDTFDASQVDLDALLADLRSLRRDIEALLGEDDLRHLRRMETIGRVATTLGVATAWIMPNPFSMTALSLGRSTRWLLMHHIGHRGYDAVPGVPPRYTSKVFARGRRRFVDWPDWMLPEAWIYEHNVLHHSHTGEARDPDLIERNTEALRSAPLPRAFKYAVMAGLALTWRSSYYAPQTLRAWRGRHEPKDEAGAVPLMPGHLRALFQTCYLPYAGLHFVGFPLLFLPLGPLAVASAFVNSIGAEALTNLHTFAVVGPNHTGDDVYRFDDKPRSRGEAMLRQILGTTNYATGGDVVDYAHLWLNYQIEHHIWPDLPMLRYREVAPKVKAICAKHGIPYAQAGVFSRIKKMLDVAVGKTSMKRVRQLTAGLRSERRPVASGADARVA